MEPLACKTVGLARASAAACPCLKPLTIQTPKMPAWLRAYATKHRARGSACLGGAETRRAPSGHQ